MNFRPIKSTKNDVVTLIAIRAKDISKYFNAVITHSGAPKFVIPIIIAPLIVTSSYTHVHWKYIFTQSIGIYIKKQVNKNTSLSPPLLSTIFLIKSHSHTAVKAKIAYIAH